MACLRFITTISRPWAYSGHMVPHSWTNIILDSCPHPRMIWLIIDENSILIPADYYVEAIENCSYYSHNDSWTIFVLFYFLPLRAAREFLMSSKQRMLTLFKDGTRVLLNHALYRDPYGIITCHFRIAAHRHVKYKPSLQLLQLLPFVVNHV